MARERLVILHGMGPDAVGLVGKITQEIARHNGNIIDLRQDVLHGLFIIYVVVDLTESQLRIEEFSDITRRISQDIGIALQADNYNPVARNPEKKNLLLILIGNDHPGIIAAISQLLGKYGINIEFARNISREGVFLMELMTEVSACTIPLDNVKTTVTAAMALTGIKTLFQTEQVFNKKKRVIVFDITGNLMDQSQRQELIHQVSLDEATLKNLLADPTGQLAARDLEGMPAATYDAIIAAAEATSDTVELLQTLKTMGYVIGLIAPASALFLETLSRKLRVDYSFGIPYEIDDDTRVFTGAIEGSFSGIDRQAVIASIVAKEKIDHDDITIINSGVAGTLPGIHPIFDLKILLDLYNRHSVSKSLLAAIIASFGSGPA
jgi:ACT domain-containing protein